MRYLLLLLLLSCTDKREIKKNKPETIEFIITEKIMFKHTKYNEFFLKNKDTIFQVSLVEYLNFDIQDTLYLEKQQDRYLHLKSYNKNKNHSK